METVFSLPELGANIESIQVVKILVKPGDALAFEQPVVELETDKATIEVPSTIAGVVTDIHVAEGAEIKPGQAILSVAGEASPLSRPDQPPAVAATPESVNAAPPTTGVPPESEVALPPPTAAPPAAPSVRRFAREIGINIADVPGSGGHGRISQEDVKAFSRRIHTASQRAADGVSALSPATAMPDFSQWGEVEGGKMSAIRHKTAQQMALSWAMCPHVTIFDQADITELEILRKRYAGLAEQAGGKLTMAVMVCKITAQALAKFPVLNASVDMDNRQIIYKRYVHLGVAVNTSRGLLVPVVRNADHKNMVEIAAEIQALAARCRDGHITLDEMTGGTFTVTNLGRICGTHFTPIIKWPEVGIMGIGRAFEAPAVVEGSIVTRTLLPLSLSFDHRVVDGADGAAFMSWIKSAIEEPLVLALDG